MLIFVDVLIRIIYIEQLETPLLVKRRHKPGVNKIMPDVLDTLVFLQFAIEKVTLHEILIRYNNNNNNNNKNNKDSWTNQNGW